jgi:hypothetical protein
MIVAGGATMDTLKYTADPERTLHIIWTNADPLTAHHMVMMYATNSMLHGWWDAVTVVLWGATQPDVCGDDDIQERIRIAEQAGVHFSACVSCANNLGLRAHLEEMGFEVVRWGPLLTELLQNRRPLITI